MEGAAGDQRKIEQVPAEKPAERKETMRKLNVVGGILMYDGKILCMQRGKTRYDYTTLKYEFPGGKVEPGETREEALRRELWEEMEIKVDVRPGDFFGTVEHDYPDFSITMATYLCKVDSPEFVRKEHASHCWKAPSEIMELDWVEADWPIVRKLAALEEK